MRFQCLSPLSILNLLFILNSISRSGKIDSLHLYLVNIEIEYPCSNAAYFIKLIEEKEIEKNHQLEQIN